MAKDWIKMRMDLSSHPKVVRILSATKSDKFRVVGGLHAVWGVFDVHSEDGVLQGYTPETMDHVIGWQGFSDAMIAVGWLQYDGNETLAMPDFDTHNGQSAKRRADETERKRKSRNYTGKVRTDCGRNADEMRSREEESREESKDKDYVPPKGGTTEYSDEFERAWQAYPKRSGGNPKKAAYQKWQARLKAGVDPEDMIAGVERYAKHCKAEGKINTQYVMQGSTFFGTSEHYLESYGGGSGQRMMYWDDVSGEMRYR